MASSCQFERLIPLLALVGVGVGVGVGVVITLSSPASRKRSLAVPIVQKRKKVGEFDYFIKEHTSPEENYITRLPDDILCHIISYLGIKDAVRTSVLSRRWRKLYCTLPNPRFECHKMFDNCHRDYKQIFLTALHKMSEFVSETYPDNCHCNYKQRFVTAVDTFFRLRSSVPMESFTLRFGLMREFPDHLRRWLNCTVACGVQRLDINFRCKDNPYKIPAYELIEFPFKVLLSACMLEYVQLSFCFLEPNFQGLSNSLKELSLCFVPLVNEEVESILSSCPQLGLLHLGNCRLSRKLLVINALELRTLKIRHCEQVNGIGLSTPNLDYFYYYGNSELSFFPSYAPNLRRLFLDLPHHNPLPHGFGDFVRGAPCLDTFWIQAVAYQVLHIQREMPTLWNLRALSLHFIEGSLDLRDIISLIAGCPNLSLFEFSSLCSLSYTERDAEVPPTFVCLKVAKLDGFKFGTAQEKFVSQLIRCAPVLEEMRIYTAHCLYSRGEEVEETLPLKKRDFSPELISKTKQRLEQHASSSSAVINIYLSCSMSL